MSESAASSAPASRPADMAAADFLRLSGHARLISSGVILLVKLAVLTACLPVWFALADQIRPLSRMRNEDLIVVASAMYGTVLLVRALASHARPFLATSATFVLTALLLGTSLWQYASGQYGGAAIAEDVIFRFITLAQPPILLLGLACIAGGAWVAHRFAGVSKRPLAVIAAGVAGMWLVALRATFDERTWARGQVSYEMIVVLLAMAGGAVAGHAAFSLFALFARKLDRPASVERLLPTFGNSPAGNYRAEFEAALLQFFAAYSSLVRLARTLLFALAAGLLVLMSYGWARDVIRRGNAESWHFWSETDVAIWVTASFVIAVVLGVAVLPAGRRNSCAYVAIFVGACMLAGSCLALATGSQSAAALLPACQVILACTSICLPACAASQFVFGFIIGRIVPGPFRRHLLPGSTASESGMAEHQSALCCEQCGYALEGLPVTRCERCGVDELRCPECGHQQPAGVLHARAMQRAHKLHIGVRVVSWIVAIGCAVPLLMPWFVIGASLGRATLFGRPSWHEVMSSALFCALYIAPLRVLALHWRPMWLASLIIGLLPLCAFGLGSSFSGDLLAHLGEAFPFLVPGWLLGAFLSPWIWRSALVAMCGSAGAQTFRWQSGKAYAHASPAAIACDAEHVAGRELPLKCDRCSADLGAISTRTCPACGVSSRTCQSCSAVRPLSAVRIAFENMVVRSRWMVLAGIAANLAAAMAVGGIALMVAGVGATINASYRPNTLAAAPVITSVIWGALVGVALIRRGRPMLLILAAASQLAIFLLLPLIVEGDASRAWATGEYRLAIVLAVMATWVTALLVRPGLRLLTWAMLPEANARALTAWLRARVTMDEASAHLNPGAQNVKMTPAPGL